jgi:ligand-binding SRPBCC domain-containing protein
MRVHQLHRRTWLPVDPDVAFAFFGDPHNLQRITPPELDFAIAHGPDGPMREGLEIEYRLRLWGVPFRWRSRIVDWRPGREFVDTAIVGPYRYWHHRHVLLAADGGTTMLDLVDYALPLQPLGEIAHPVVRRQLARIFDFREATIQAHFRGGGTDHGTPASGGRVAA